MTQRILVAGHLLGDGPSGANRRLLETLRALEPLLDTGESITVLHRPDALPEHLPSGIQWREVDLPSHPSWRRALAERRHLPKIAAELAADVVELGMLPVPPRMPCPVTLTLHDLRDLHDGIRRRPAFVVRHVLRSSLRRVASVAVPSRFTADELRTSLGGFTPPLEIVPGGVGAEFFEPHRHPESARPFFLHVGHLEARKNLVMLLSAFAQFLDDGGWRRRPPEETPTLVLVGRDAGTRDELAERAAFLDLTSHVRMPGAVDDATLRELYSATRGVMIPSRYEGFGQPVLEALAAGAPVCVADSGALPEVLGDAGRILPADDAGAWANAFELHAADPDPDDELLRRRVRRDRARAFSWRRTAELQLGLWRAAMGT